MSKELRDVRITFRVPQTVRDAAEVCAARDRRTLSSWIEVLIARECERVLIELHAEDAPTSKDARR